VPEIFYWIDFCCFDQRKVDDYLPMLPVWVACCERIVRYETEDYLERAWCRLELLLAYTFGFADHHVSIKAGFSASEAYDGVKEEQLLLRPVAGLVTNADDFKKIDAVENFALRFEPVTTDRRTGRRLPPVSFGKTTVKCFRL
jgi:hypothetical protein